MAFFIFTNSACSTQVAGDYVIDKAPSDIHPSPATSGDMGSFILTDTVSSTHVAGSDVTAVCLQTE